MRIDQEELERIKRLAWASAGWGVYSRTTTTGNQTIGNQASGCKPLRICIRR